MTECSLVLMFQMGHSVWTLSVDAIHTSLRSSSRHTLSGSYHTRGQCFRDRLIYKCKRIVNHLISRTVGP